MLSVAMIVKNEIQTLESTVKSVREYVDEVVIGVDEESTDGTLALAEKLADNNVVLIKLSEELRNKKAADGDGEWGFCAARNKVLDKCKKRNWRITLDGHEAIKDPQNIKKAVAKAKRAKADSIEVRVDFEPNQDGVPQLIYNQVRIFAPSVRYNRPIHNVPITKKTVFDPDVIFQHLKKHQATESRNERNIQRADSNINSLAEEVEKNPQDSRSWFYLAAAYKESGMWRDAVGAYLSYLKVGTWKEERWHARANMGACYSRLGKNEKAREQFVLSLEEFPVMAESYYWLGDMAYKQQRFREAQVWLEKCIQLEIPQCKLFVTPGIYMVNRHDLLSMTYSHLGMYKEAIEQAEKVLEVSPSARIGKNISIWKGLVKNA